MVRTREDAIRYLKNGPMASYQRHGFGLNAVLVKEYDTPIGLCGLLKREELEAPDIGYAFLDNFCGKGYALEAAKSVLTHTLKSHALPNILAMTLPENASSKRLLSKLGFTLTSSIELYNSLNNLYELQTSKLKAHNDSKAS